MPTLWIRLSIAASLLLVSTVALGQPTVSTPPVSIGGLGGVVSIGDGILSFGDFNGTTQQPFRLALKELQNGGTIEVLPGNYSFKRPVELAANGLTVRGSAGAKLMSVSASDIGLFRITGDNIRISGLQIRTQTPAAGQSSIFGLGASTTIDHCTFSALGGAVGFRFLSFGDGVTFRRGTLIESNSFLFSPNSADVIGVTLRLGLDLRMVNNEFRPIAGGAGLLRYAVEIESESKGTINGNSFQNLGSGANLMQAVIYSNSDTEGHHFAIASNFVENCQATQVLHLSGGRFCSISGNVFGRLLNSSGGVIRLSASGNGNNGSSNVIASNQFHNVVLAISADDCIWTTISGNQFSLCGTPQVDIGPGADGAVLVGNQFIGSPSITANISRAITITGSVDHLVQGNACMSQNPQFGFINVVISNSTDANISNNFNS